MAKGMLKYGKEEESSSPGKDEKKGERYESASEMHMIELMEKAFSPPYSSEMTDMERKRKQLSAAKEFIHLCMKG